MALVGENNIQMTLILSQYNNCGISDAYESKECLASWLFASASREYKLPLWYYPRVTITLNFTHSIQQLKIPLYLFLHILIPLFLPHPQMFSSTPRILRRFNKIKFYPTPSLKFYFKLLF